MAPEEPEIILTVGSRYRVKSIESREKPLITHGVFKGYAAIGHDQAICIELDESHSEHSGRIRLIPLHMIVSIDVIQVATKPERDEEVQRMFG